jgi:P27 family predicted phage terminase small subunit
LDGAFSGENPVFMGRTPTPTSLKVIRGNPGQRPINSSEPSAPPADLTPPDVLSEHGVEVWSEMAPLLARMGVFTQADRFLLTRYCLLQEQFSAVVKHVREHGMTQLTSTGYSQLTAEGSLFKTLPADLLKIEQQFGMTPAARSSIKVSNAAAQENPLASFIQKRSG